jgi:hypothetical protein
MLASIPLLIGKTVGKYGVAGTETCPTRKVLRIFSITANMFARETCSSPRLGGVFVFVSPKHPKHRDDTRKVLLMVVKSFSLA